MRDNANPTREFSIGLPIFGAGQGAGQPNQQGTFYSVIGGIDCLIKVGEHFAAAVRRTPDFPAHLTGTELQWLQVRLVQLLASASGAPLEYAGPRLHELYNQHLLAPLLHPRFDELIMQAMYQAHISRVFVQVLVNIARDGEEAEDFTSPALSQQLYQ